MLGWIALLACRPSTPADRSDATTGHSGSAAHTARSESAADTGLPMPTGDTGPYELPCDTGVFPGQEVLPDRTWRDTDRQDGAGQDLWVGDLDGDGRDEVLVGASNATYATPSPESTAYLLTGVPDSGALPEVARTTITGWTSYDDFGSVVVGLPSEHLIGIGLSPVSYEEVSMYFYDPRGPVQAGTDFVGQLHTPNLYGWSDAEDCNGVSGGAFLCVSALAQGASDQVFLYPAPFGRTLEEADSTTILDGQPGEEAILLRSGQDLDGDGLNDLVVGAVHAEAAAGRIAIVSSPPAGELDLWQTDDATFTGTEVYGELGVGLDLGDLDGDGHVDLFGGAMGGGPGHGYVFLGPFSGDGTDADAAVTVDGTDCHVWTGYSGALADVDGDGETDLAMAQARVYAVGGPGRALVFRGPLAGHYTQAEADVWVDSPAPSTDTDWFGYRMRAGDLDGDGRADLVITAPYDDGSVPGAGAVHLVLGSSL